MKHIYLDKLFLLFLLIIVFTGSFNRFIPYLSLLLIHEFGHAITGIILGYQLDKIVIYPYGGITKFNLPLNIPLQKELLILIMGPIMQTLGYLILNNFFYDIKIFHYTLLFFNLLPLYPLDGGKIINILFCYHFNYLKSFYITFIISIIIVILLLFYNIIYFNLNMLLMVIIMFGKLFQTYKKRYYYYNRFLLERYLHQYSFRRVKCISNIKQFYRDNRHYINYKCEKDALQQYFLRK